MRVVKIGGRAQSDPNLPAALARLWREEPGALCIVHGGGDDVTALQRRLGGQPTFLGGRRVTTSDDVELLRMALSGAANKRLVAALVTAGAPAVGLSGEDGGLLAAVAIDRARFGLVGRAPSVNAALVHHLLAGGFLPVISPIARDREGAAAALNVNADDAAASVAVALNAEELLLIADVPGVLVDGIPQRELDARSAMDLVARGSARDGMAAKLEAAQAASEGGVCRVRIGDAGMLLSGDCGTFLTADRSYA